MESILLLVFSCLDIVFFYVFFESVLIPMYLILGFFGSRERKILASYMFFIYTFVGSVLMLLAILFIYFYVGTSNYIVLLTCNFDPFLQKILWIAFFVSFAVKVPMIPFYIWLPEAHVEAPTPGSVILAGILLKLGTYGFLRFSLPLFTFANFYYTPFVYTISILGLIYSSLVAIRQTDLKRIVAYASIAHMNLIMIGLYTNKIYGIEGSLLQMFSHGLVSGALFLIVGVKVKCFIDDIIGFNKELQPEIICNISKIGSELDIKKKKLEDIKTELEKKEEYERITYSDKLNKIIEEEEKKRSYTIVKVQENAEKILEKEDKTFAQLIKEKRKIIENKEELEKDIRLRNKFLEILEKGNTRIREILKIA